MTRFLVLILAGLVGLQVLRGQEEAPLFTVNTAMHSAMINRISTDSLGRYLLTCGEDKTAKLWDATNGQFIRTFRPYLATGPWADRLERDELPERVGELYAAALSPDARHVAVGGYSAGHRVSIFETNSGLLIHTLPDCQNNVTDLEYSPDGQFLAVSLSGDRGLRVFETTHYTLLYSDRNYTKPVRDLTYDRAGRLATASYDGLVRLYDPQCQQLGSTGTTGGKEPHSLAFSPDGSVLAVGFRDSSTVQVLDGHTLEVLYSATTDNTDDLNEKDLMVVAFSSNGEHLVAGGALKKRASDGTLLRQLRVWQQAGRGAFTDVPSGGNIIMDLRPLPNGRIAFCSYKPDLGTIDPALGERALYLGSEKYSFEPRDSTQFRVGRSGWEVSFKPKDQEELSFSLRERRLEQKTTNHPVPRSARPGAVVNWKDPFIPLLNGDTLDILRKNERCLSVDVADDASRVVIGSDWYVRCVDTSGTLQWEKRVQGGAWLINVDENGEVVVAALGDGTIRWYRLEDGEPLLALYIHAEDQRWALWTASGYFHCSLSAESLVGWHADHGPDSTSSYYSLSRFREKFNRADIVDLVLETLDEDSAITQANLARQVADERPRVSENVPPTVHIHSPASGDTVSSARVTIQYSLETPQGAPAIRVWAIVNGQPVENTRGLKPIDHGDRYEVSIPMEDCIVALYAENRHGKSEGASIQLKWKGTPPPTPTVDTRPSLYVLSVGISDYQHDKIKDLDYAEKDAQDFVEAMRQHVGPFYGLMKDSILVGAAATRASILKGLKWLGREVTSNDIAMIFIAGHGWSSPKRYFHFLPYDAVLGEESISCVTEGDMFQGIADVNCKKLLFLDACHAGMLTKTRTRGAATPMDIDALMNDLAGMDLAPTIFAAASSYQEAIEDPAWENGAFTNAFVLGMSGEAAKNEKEITVQGLQQYLSNKVKEITDGAQTPCYKDSEDMPDFSIGAKLNP